MAGMAPIQKKCVAATPYCAPLADWPSTSSAPRLAEMKARPVIQAGSERPERK